MISRCALVIMSGALLPACFGDESKPPPSSAAVVSISMDASRWVFQHSHNVPSSPRQSSSGGWEFDFPGSDGVHYLVTPVSGRMPGAVAASMRVEKGTGAIFRESDPCTDPHVAAVRLYFQRRGDDLTTGKQDWRWWSVDRYLLDDPAGELVVPVVAEKWHQVFGNKGDTRVNEFTAAASDVQVVGLTFGGCFAGHGVYVIDGAAKFIAVSVEGR